MSELTALREAVDAVATHAGPPDFGVLERRATRRRRRRVAVVLAATVAVLAGLAWAVTGVDGDRPSPAGPITPKPGPQSEAERIIATGSLESFTAAESGDVLTVWSTCHDLPPSACGYAWRIGTGSRTRATGMLDRGDPYSQPTAIRRSFVITPARERQDGLRIAADGTTSPLTFSSSCGDVAWSAGTEPGRLVWVPWGQVIDTVTSAVCGTGQLGDRSLAQSAIAGGVLWGLVENETPASRLTIGRYDGAGWRYRDLAAPGGGSGESLVAAAGPNVVVLHARQADARLVGLSVTTDDGASWTEVSNPQVLARDLPFSTYVSPDHQPSATMAFAGPEALYVADGKGYLWRSTDFTTFRRVSLVGPVSDLRPAGGAVLARLGDPNQLALITASGSVQTITTR